MGDRMSNYLVIKDDKVVNIVVWDGVSEWMPPVGTTVQLAPEGVGIGWVSANGEWVAPDQHQSPAEDPAKISARAKLTALGLTEDELKAILE
jgi:hypothetical protein